jgi:hypothetical protein
MSSTLVWAIDSQMKGDGLANTTVLFLHSFSSRFLRKTLVRGATQNLSTYLLCSLEQLYTHRQPRRNAPYPRARRIYCRPMMPS